MNKQIRHWILTIPYHEFTPYLAPNTVYIKGQLEKGSEGGEESGYLHWQVYVILRRTARLAALKKTYGQSCHAEPTRSDAAEDYCWKEDTRVFGTQFELGEKPFRRDNSKDWQQILDSAKSGNFDVIPPDVYIRCYGSLKRIAVENAKPEGIERTCIVYWGETETGKSRAAWSEATYDAYPKDPCTKFWDGYRGQENVVIDEFRGSIGISHLLRWLDRYPVIVEVKGGSVVLKAKRVWITSNLHPDFWYPQEDRVTVNALKRRLQIVQKE